MEEKKKKATEMSINLDGSEYKTTGHAKYERRKAWQKPDERQLYSYIPGVILDVMVKEGDTLAEGDEVIILEAMKMKNRIQTPVSGTVRKLHVKVGDCIPKGKLMLELE